MKKNISVADRFIRIIISFLLAGLYAAHILTGTLAIVLLVVAAILTLTAFVNFCPLYFVLGIKKWQKKSA